MRDWPGAPALRIRDLQDVVTQSQEQVAQITRHMEEFPQPADQDEDDRTELAELNRDLAVARYVNAQ